MIKIAIHEPMRRSAVAYYRSIGTLSYLQKIDPRIEIKILDQVSWDNLAGVDIMYMERPQEDGALQAFKIAKDFNVKIWVDYDDFLHGIPAYNPSHDFYTKTEVLKTIEYMMENADIVSVSTPFLKDFYSKFNKNIHVIENAHNDYQYPFEKIEKTTDTIHWRGSATHRDDLLSVADNIFMVAKNHKSYHWVFTGCDVWYITNQIENVFTLKECDITDYNKFIKQLSASMQIVPLANNDFNRSKSNIGWLEGTYAGSASIVPDLPEFRKPGCVNYIYENPDSFGYYLEKTMKSKEFRQKQYKDSYEYIKDNLLLSIVNKKRIELIESLV